MSEIAHQTSDLSGYTRQGREFSDVLPHHLADADVDRAVFSPTGEGSLAEMAYAGYHFNHLEATGSMIIQLEWDTAPAWDLANPKLWVGLANWDMGTWEWIVPVDLSVLTINDIAPYIEPGYDNLYMILIVCGTDQAVLNELGFPSIEPPDLGPRVEYLNRIAGQPGEVVKMSAYVHSLNPASWSWDFGGGADPNTTTNSYPEVTLGAAGVYDCNLTVTSEDGTDSYDFKLHVTDDLYLVGGKTGIDWTMGEDTYIDLLLSNGNGDLVTSSDDEGLFLFRNIPNGSYTLTPIKYENWVPVSDNVLIENGSVTNLRFYRGESTNTRVIQGSIWTTGGSSVECPVDMTGDETRTAPSGVVFTGLSDGNYRITPNDPTYNFCPEYRDVVINKTSAHRQNFICSMGPISKYTLGGNVTVDGQPAAGITIKLEYAWWDYAVTDASGYYEFTDLPVGPGDAELYPHLPEEEFSVVPSWGHIVEVDSDKTGLNFAITLE